MKKYIPFILTFFIIPVLIVVLLCITYYVGYTEGINKTSIENMKNYQAACVLNNICNNMIENIGSEAEEIYYETLDNLDCHSNIFVTKKDVTNYKIEYK